MFQSIKRLTAHSAIYGLSDVLGRSIAYLLVPIYTHVMPIDQFGYYGLIYSFIAIANVFFLYGIDVAFLRFYVIDNKKRSEILSTAYLSLILTSIVLVLFIVIFAEKIAPIISTSSSLTSYVKLAGIILALDALNAIPFARLRGDGKASSFASLKLLKVFIELGGNYNLVVVHDMGLEGILISNIIGSSVVFLILTILTFKQLSWSWSRNIIGKLLKFGLPYVPAGASIIIIETIDRVMLERMSGTEVLGIYHAARKLGVGMLIFVTMFRQAWQPFFLETSKEENPKPLFARVMTYFLVIAGGLFLALSFLMDDLVRFQWGSYTLIEESYWDGVKIVPFLIIAYILYGIYVNLTVAIYLKKKTTLLPYITGTAALICILLNLWLIPKFDMYGAATASVVAYGVMVTGLYLVGRKYYPVPYEYLRLFKVALVCGGLYGIHIVINSSWLWEVILVIIGYPVILFAIRFFTGDEIAFVRRRLHLHGK